MDNVNHVDIVNISTIRLGCLYTLKDVQHVPSIHLNLLSTYSLDLGSYYSCIDDQE